MSAAPLRYRQAAPVPAPRAAECSARRYWWQAASPAGYVPPLCHRSNIHFRQTKNGIGVSWLPRQDILICSASGGVITSLLRPVSQREVYARGRWLLAQHRFRFSFFAAFSQAISGFQYLIALQSINQLLNIAAPPARGRLLICASAALSWP